MVHTKRKSMTLAWLVIMIYWKYYKDINTYTRQIFSQFACMMTQLTQYLFVLGVYVRKLFLPFQTGTPFEMCYDI